MKTTLIFLMLGCSLSIQANTFFEQLCAFNPNWSKYRSHVPIESEHVFLSDKQYIQSHLSLVLEVLKSADVNGLSEEQLSMRTHLITLLSDYRSNGVFPINYYCSERIPVFIDEHHTHCAVGYLMKETGYGNLALQISKSDNYIWVKDLKGEEVIEWQQLSGFSLEELKLIQGAYDSYMPFALKAPNRIEIPQKPEVISLNFKEKDLSKYESRVGINKVWIRGEGKKGVLHGRWEQNYSPTLPWIVGFYQHGKREGKWFEYYQGTDKLCRTEHWRNDKLNGIRTRFDRRGNVIEEILFEDGNAVLKTNYELNQSLKYVRKLLEESKVWTEVYDLAGNILASGHETVENPGNLQWFQNIELTALNTMSLSSQTFTQSIKTKQNGGTKGRSSTGTSIQLYSEPTLVNYIKQGDWVYYKDVEDHPDSKSVSTQLMLMNRLFMLDFNRLGSEILTEIPVLSDPTIISGFDSVRVNYSEGKMNYFNGYRQKKRSRIEFEWYSGLNFRSNYSIHSVSRFHPLNSYPNDWVASYKLKSYGFVNENDEKINKWYYFNEFGNLARVEEFILPQKKEIGVEIDH